MSKDIKIKNGLTIKLKGAAQNIVKKAAFPKSVSINPSDFHLIIPKMTLKVGEKVSQGDVVFFSKKDDRIKFCSPVDGVITDIVSLKEIASEFGVPLIIDNTMATPYLCQPIEHGADIVVHSTTKFLSGHGNAMGLSLIHI